MNNLTWLIPLFPLLGFLINGLGRNKLSKSAISFIGSGVILASFVASLMIFFQVKDAAFQGPHIVTLFDFIKVGSIHIPFAFQIDQLSSIFLLIITGVGFLIHVYSAGYMHDDEGFGRYFSYLNLFVFSMLLLVMGANYVIMFIGWEGVGLCSYLLIGFWFKNNSYNYAARKAFVMNRIGDLGFLLGIFLMLGYFSSVNFEDVFAQAAGMEINDTILVAITLLLFVGAMGKSAQIPLYTWLPDAMAGPTPVSALIHAATMVTAGIYMIARSNILYSMSHLSQTVVAIVGLTTAIFAATIALKQNDIKKVLAYSTVSQLGYMFLGLGVGAYTGAVFHVMTHAFFKALLFLGAGSVIHAMGGEQDIRKMGGLSKHMKITHLTFLLACFAIAGIPPFSGFFSKDEILIAAFAHNPLFYYIGLGGALLTAFYMFRLFFLTFTGSFRGTEDQHKHLHESPASMTFPLLVLAILSVVGGFVGIPEIFGGGHQLSAFLAPVFEPSSKILAPHHIDHATEWLMLGVSTVLILGVIVFAWMKYKVFRDKESKGLEKVMENKWYVDELYDNVFVNPILKFGKFLNSQIERLVIDGVVNGVGKAVNYSSRQIRLIQNGQVGSYVIMMVLAMLLLILIKFFV